MRIERGNNLGFWDFVCRWEDRDGKIARNYAPHFFFDDEPDTPFTLCLIHQNSSAIPGTTRCMFLDEDAPSEGKPLGEARCGNYENRPMACRVFPTKLDDSGQFAVIQPVPERARESSHPVYDLCSREWTETDIDPVQSIHDLIITQHEMVFFSKLASAWNRNPGPWQFLPEFLSMVYSRRIKSDVPTSDATRDEQAA